MYICIHTYIHEYHTYVFQNIYVCLVLFRALSRAHCHDLSLACASSGMCVCVCMLESVCSFVSVCVSVRVCSPAHSPEVCVCSSQEDSGVGHAAMSLCAANALTEEI